ncbi:MAG: replicative DNA helicase [bacterium]|nr:replicative DNA helicase [bacterium]
MFNFEIEKGSLPQAPEAEGSLIAAIILNNNVLDEVGSMLTSDMFFSGSHRRIYSVIVELFSDRQSIDIVTISERLREKGELDAAGGAAYLPRIVSHCGDTKNYMEYATIIRDKAVKRQMMEDCKRIYQKCLSDSCSALDALEDAQRTFTAISLDDGNPECTLADCQGDARDRYQADHPGGVSGVPTGYAVLNQITHGFQPSNYIILAARPSMGKTALAINMSIYAAKMGFVPCIFSLEMSKDQITDRINAIESGVNLHHLRGGLKPGEFAMLNAAEVRLRDCTIVIDDNDGLHFGSVRSRARLYQRKYGANFFIVDYLQLVAGDNKSDRTVEIGTVSRAMKGIAKELKAPVMALSQLNRALESRADKRPKLSDLRRSGSLEQDADLAVFLYRDEVYNEATDESGTAEVEVLKHRDGPTGKFKLRWFKESTVFKDIIPGWEP